ncbi:hypothetical protein QJS66_18215 [Kocuria rhizophila]|nr:hypothetical protein QJS66_18215 [Kocuria rhizophila]
MLSVGTAVALVLLAVTELQVAGAQTAGEPLTEDERWTARARPGAGRSRPSTTHDSGAVARFPCVHHAAGYRERDRGRGAGGPGGVVGGAAVTAALRTDG